MQVFVVGIEIWISPFWNLVLKRLIFENWKLKLENWKLKIPKLKTWNLILVSEHRAWAHAQARCLGPVAHISARRSDFPYLFHCMLADRVLRTHKAKLVGINAGVCSRDWNLNIAILKFGFEASDFWKLKVEAWRLKTQNFKIENLKLNFSWWAPCLSTRPSTVLGACGAHFGPEERFFLPVSLHARRRGFENPQSKACGNKRRCGVVVGIEIWISPFWNLYLKRLIFENWKLKLENWKLEIWKLKLEIEF